MLSFYKALLKNPRRIGSIIPSSSFLAQAVAKAARVKNDELIVELGAGTGVITQGLLDYGIPAERIVPVEISNVMTKTLEERFPQLNIIHGSAFELAKLIKPLNKPIGTVICGLPLLIFSQKELQQILNQVDQILTPGGRYIKYTYRFKDIWEPILPHYTKVKNAYIFLNIPPARVCIYEAPK